MGRRRGVAATLASVAIFTMMLVANAAVYGSQNSFLSAVRLSSAQVQESGYSGVLTGVAAFDALAQAQSLLESNPMDCSHWQAYLASLSGEGTDRGLSHSVTYSVESSWSYVSSSSLTGDALLSGRFDGYSPGALNLQVAATVSETYLGGLPSYSSETTEVVHLPVQPAATSSGCLAALSELRSSLSAGSCNSSLIAGEVSQAQTRFPLLASFDAGASAAPGLGRCSVDYWVRTYLTETGVYGTFRWAVFGTGSLSS
jgi:hypothetical protein